MDFQVRTLRLNPSLQRIQGKLQLSQTKIQKSRRVLDLPDSLITNLKAHRLRQLQEKLLAGSKWVAQGLVFTSTFGTTIDPRNVKRRLDSV